MKKILTLSFLRTIALIMVLAGAGGSLGLMLNAGRHTPVLLLVLFVGWVLSPFIALLIANVVSKRWSSLTCKTLYILMLVITLVSLVSYSGALTPPETKPASIFLVVPLTSWLLIMTAIPIARRMSSKNNSTNKT